MITRTRRHRWFAISAIAWLLATAGGQAVLGETVPMPSPPRRIAKAVRCLVGADFVREDLRGLGLKIGETVPISYQVGSIPGTMPTPGLIHIAFFAKDEQRGWLFLVDSDQKSGFVVVRNAYRLTRGGDKWQADEGSGGLATYRAVSRFATTLFSGRRYAVHLVPAKTGCSVE